jgi:tRNA dimethylallyltransferase
MKKDKIIVILGQTSTGKSDFAVEIAKLIDAEIISADSRQVYKGMDLGTGKITKKEMKGVPHHLLDVVSPSKIFSVSDFQKLATQKIDEIFSRQRVPIICGGTGFYIDSIINGVTFPKVPPNKKLREILDKKSAEQLFEMLKKLDKERALNIDKNNKVRLIRAIEIVQALGQVPSLESFHRSDLWKSSTGRTCGNFINFQVLKIGLTLPPEILKDRIKNRLLTRLKKGMLKEMENLHQNGLSWRRMEALGLEYRYGALYLQGKISKEELIEKIQTKSWHYAKRQNTWFKRDKEIIWINPTRKSEKQNAIEKIKMFLE